MRARVTVRNARIVTDPHIITARQPHILVDVALDEDDGEHKESTLFIRVIGEVDELFALKEWITRGTIVCLHGRMIGNRNHFMSCWARHVWEGEADEDDIDGPG